MSLSMKLLCHAPALLAGLLIGCAVYVEPDGDSACDDICGANASCKKGVCVCDPGYAGVPEAEQGCQPTTVEGSCGADGCGLNAYCGEDNLCYCNAGSVAVCGTGDCLPLDNLCDGEAHCPNQADEAMDLCYPIVVMEWSVIDSCADGYDIEWRLFSEDRGWIWPSADTVFVSAGLDVEVIEAIECTLGEWICFGGAAGSRTWGVGLAGDLGCEDCCWECGNYRAEVPYLICN